MESFKDLLGNYLPTERDILEKEIFLVDVDLTALLGMGNPPATTAHNKRNAPEQEYVRLDNIPLGIKIKTKCGAIVMMDKTNQFTRIL